MFFTCPLIVLFYHIAIGKSILNFYIDENFVIKLENYAKMFAFRQNNLYTSNINKYSTAGGYSDFFVLRG